MRRLVLAALIPVSALVAQAPVATRAASDSTYSCIALADSLRATVARDKLPVAMPRGEVTLVRTPVDAQLGRAIRSSVLVHPDGQADTTTVVITGTTDDAYRRDFIRTVARASFRAPVIRGCRVWGSYWIAVANDGHYRSPP